MIRPSRSKPKPATPPPKTTKPSKPSEVNVYDLRFRNKSQKIIAVREKNPETLGYEFFESDKRGIKFLGHPPLRIREGHDESGDLWRELMSEEEYQLSRTRTSCSPSMSHPRSPAAEAVASPSIASSPLSSIGSSSSPKHSQHRSQSASPAPAKRKRKESSEADRPSKKSSKEKGKNKEERRSLDVPKPHKPSSSSSSNKPTSSAPTMTPHIIVLKNLSAANTNSSAFFTKPPIKKLPASTPVLSTALSKIAADSSKASGHLPKKVEEASEPNEPLSTHSAPTKDDLSFKRKRPNPAEDPHPASSTGDQHVETGRNGKRPAEEGPRVKQEPPNGGQSDPSGQKPKKARSRMRSGTILSEPDSDSERSTTAISPPKDHRSRLNDEEDELPLLTNEKKTEGRADVGQGGEHRRKESKRKVEKDVKKEDVKREDEPSPSWASVTKGKQSGSKKHHFSSDDEDEKDDREPPSGSTSARRPSIKEEDAPERESQARPSKKIKSTHSKEPSSSADVQRPADPTDLPHEPNTPGSSLSFHTKQSTPSTSSLSGPTGKKDRVSNLKKHPSTASADSSPSGRSGAGAEASSPAVGNPKASVKPLIAKKAAGKKEPGVGDASFYTTLLKPAFEKASTTSKTSHILEKETKEKKAAAAEIEKQKQLELEEIQKGFTANGPLLDLESQADVMRSFTLWAKNNLGSSEQFHNHGGQCNIWEAALNIKQTVQNGRAGQLACGKIGPGKTREENGMMPLPKTFAESNDLTFAFVGEMEGKWGDSKEVERYLNDPKYFPFGRGLA